MRVDDTSDGFILGPSNPKMGSYSVCNRNFYLAVPVFHFESNGPARNARE